ncbi:DUF4350 domain-containing protein [Aureibaculum sp. 2210JD6-5]|uniref:DUF4350 domain-containing protein n=1 Tax=Aureibaculum sp. 2210JD6-5 TaxID=3103957 RepID=UPI002AAECACD|nr:DUF4350 domain-containing protein [Aureibaculum sp. 2210JD6-5]MDY7395045.1 DUF4350 domain-containing protein [Aureibaculum sp. 2210JD6-5]
MSKRSKILLGVAILVFMAFIYVESVKPKPLNWFPSYVAKHKMPYGTYVLRNELDKIFPNTEIQNVDIPPYTFLQDTTKAGTYFFVDDGINFGDDEFNKLLEFVSRGNDVFISTHGANIDTLNLETKPISSVAFEQKAFFKFYNKNLSNKEFHFDRGFYNSTFSEIDTLNTIALGKTGYLNENNKRVSEGINFIKHPHGNGNFYFHTFPEAFTNYFILKSPNQQYTASVLSYLDSSKPILWDAYYKTGKSRITSPMQYLLSSKSLKWAYYITLFGVLILILFEGKRKQRYIPIITPLKNQTLAFTRTIANMYYEKSEHKNIAEHKITYLLEYIRTKLHVPTVTINDNFYNYVASRSGHSLEDVKKLFKEVDKIHQTNNITKEELIKLNSLIEKFKNPA